MRQRGLGCIGGLLALVLGSASAADFVVRDAGSNGDGNLNDNVCSTVAPANANTCTLRAAIQQANALAGTHTIKFDGPVTKITLSQSLPQVTARVTLDGSNPSASGSGGRVEIDGAGTNGCFDLRDTQTATQPNGATDSTVRNFVIRRCQGAGISLSGHGYTVTGNRIGTNPAGSSGSSASDANSGPGISVSGTVMPPGSPPGLASLLANPPESFAAVAAFATSLRTALTVIAKPTTISGNLVSGNTGAGIVLFGQSTVNTFVAGNIVGLSQDGLSAVPNGRGPTSKDGIRLEGTAYGNFIGPGNIVSGNLGDGIALQSGSVLLPNFVAGNLIGLGSAPTEVGNANNGISVDSNPKTSGPGANNPTGFAAFIGPANTISDNNSDAGGAALDVVNGDTSGGLIVTGASRGIEVFANVVGLATFPAGSTPLGQLEYGNSGNGMVITVPGVRISRNLILANGRHGILLRGNGTDGVRIVGNFIGVSVPTGLAPFVGLGNAGDGVHLFTASSTQIGGPGASDKNIIAGNGRNGIALRNGSATNGWANLIQRNEIYGNGRSGSGIGIDLERQPNVPDEFNPNTLPTNWSNFDQPAPILCGGAAAPPECGAGSAPSFAAAGTSLRWTLPARPQTFAHPLRVEFYANAADGSGQAFLGEQTVTLNLSGQPSGAGCSNGVCAATVGGGGDTSGMAIVATATDLAASDVPPVGTGGSNAPANNTSEFSVPVTARRALEITTTPPLPPGTTGAPYSVTFQAVGGSGTYSAWAIVQGNLPNGLALGSATGTLAGTPSAGGTFNFALRVTDSEGAQATAAYSIAVTQTPALAITTPSPLPQATVGSAYSQTLLATGGSGAASGWNVAFGALAPGLSLGSSSGTLAGTPTTPGSYEFTVSVSDGAANSATRAYTLTVVPAPVPLAITTASPLPDATQNASYQQALAATGGSGIYSAWALSAGALPAGLMLDAASGVIGGKPTGSGGANFTVRVTDSAGASATRAYALNVIAVPPPPTGPSITFSPASIDFGRVRVGSSATAQITVRNESASPFDPEIALDTGPIVLLPTIFSVNQGNCTSNLAVGQSCTFSVTFRPRRGGGVAYAEDALLTYELINTRVVTIGRVPITGTGDGRLADVAPVAIDFGTQVVGSNTQATVLIENPTGSTLELTGGTLLAGSGFTGPQITCAGAGNTLPPGGSCSVAYRFIPAVIGAAGGQARINLAQDVGSFLLPAFSDSFDITLSGTGVSVASATTTRPTRLDFGDVQVGRSMRLAVTTRNNTGANVGVSGGTFPAGADAEVWSRAAICSNPTAPAADCVFQYDFVPRAAQPYTINTALTVTLAGTSQQVPLALSGRGTGSIARIGPTALDLGRVPVNKSNSGQVTVTNLAEVALNVEIALATPFERTTTCGATLAAGASCSVTYRIDADGSEIGPLLADARIRLANGAYLEDATIRLSADVIDGLFGNGFE